MDSKKVHGFEKKKHESDFFFANVKEFHGFEIMFLDLNIVWAFKKSSQI